MFFKNGVLRPTILLKKRLWHRCFPMKFVKFPRTPFCKEHLWWLLLIKVTNKLTLWFLMETVKHSQSFQNSNFTMSLQYLKKVRDEIVFLHVDKHQRFLQVYFNTLSIKVFYKVMLLLLMGMTKHSQRTQSNKFAISLQYLKKGVKNGILYSLCFHKVTGDKSSKYFTIKLFNKNRIKFYTCNKMF